MTPADRLLASLAAAIAPGRAGALLARLASADAGPAREHAERLVPASRAERLSALAAAVAAVDAETCRRSPTSLERTRVKELLLALQRGLAPGGRVSPALVRIGREQLWG